MTSIGVKELSERTSEVLQRVRDELEEYVITYQGLPIARLLPVRTTMTAQPLNKQSTNQPWEVYGRLADSLRRIWPAPQRTQALLDDIRRG